MLHTRIGFCRSMTQLSWSIGCWQLSTVTAVTAAARQAAVAAEKVPVNVDAVNRSYVTLGSFSWDQDNDKIKVGPSFVVSIQQTRPLFF